MYEGLRPVWDTDRYLVCPGTGPRGPCPPSVCRSIYLTYGTTRLYTRSSHHSSPNRGHGSRPSRQDYILRPSWSPSPLKCRSGPPSPPHLSLEIPIFPVVVVSVSPTSHVSLEPLTSPATPPFPTNPSTPVRHLRPVSPGKPSQTLPLTSSYISSHPVFLLPDHRYT